MNTKTVLGVSLAAVFAISMIVPAMAAMHPIPPYLDGVPDEVVITEKNAKTTKIKITAPDEITRHETFFGGWAIPYTSGDFGVFAIASHDPARDSNQNPDGWHVHNLSTDDAGCITAGTDDTTAGIKIKGNMITLQVANKKLSGDLNGEGTYPFEIVPDETCDSGLKVVDLS